MESNDPQDAQSTPQTEPPTHSHEEIEQATPQQDAPAADNSSADSDLAPDADSSGDHEVPEELVGFKTDAPTEPDQVDQPDQA